MNPAGSTVLAKSEFVERGGKRVEGVGGKFGASCWEKNGMVEEEAPLDGPGRSEGRLKLDVEYGVLMDDIDAPGGVIIG